MGSISSAIKAEAKKGRWQIQDDETKQVYDLFANLFAKKPNPKQEIIFEKNLFTRGTGEERSGLHLSAIIGPDSTYCIREQVLSLLYRPLPHEEQLHDLGLLRIFEEGNYVHRKWQRLFLRGGLCTPDDLDCTQWNSRYSLSFSPDAIVNVFGQRTVIEVKSMNMFAFDKTNKHLSGEKQCRMYMALSKTRQGIVIMENKNNQQFKLQLIKHEMQPIAPYIARLDNIRECQQTKEMPTRRLDCKSPLSKRCTQCSMAHVCWSNTKEREVYRIDKKSDERTS